MNKITYYITLLPNKSNTPYPVFVSVGCRKLNVQCRFATGLKVHPSIWSNATKRAVPCSYVNVDYVFEVNYKLNNICQAIEKHINAIYKKPQLFEIPDKLKKKIHELYYIIKDEAKKLPTFVNEVNQPIKKEIEENEQLKPYTMAKTTKKIKEVGGKRKYKNDIPNEIYKWLNGHKKHTYNNDNKSTLEYLEIFLSKHGNKQFANIQSLATTKAFKAWTNFFETNKTKSGKPFSATTANKYINTLLKLIRYVYVEDKEVITPTQLTNIIIKKFDNHTDQKGNEIALTVEELWKIYNYQPQNRKEEIAKDTLLFLCTSSVRISDNEEMMLSNNIKEFAQRKTSHRQSRIFCFKWAEEIIEKWTNRDDKPHISNSKGDLVNTMKIVAKNAGINGPHLVITQDAGKRATTEQKERWELVATHTGRRTFATLCWEMGMEKTTIAEYTCQSPKMVDHYIKSNETKKKQFVENVKNGDIILPPYYPHFFDGGVVKQLEFEKEKEKQEEMLSQQLQQLQQLQQQMLQPQPITSQQSKEDIIREYEEQKRKEEEIKNDILKKVDLQKLIEIGINEDEAKKRVEQAYKLYSNDKNKRQRVMEGWPIEEIENYYNN